MRAGVQPVVRTNTVTHTTVFLIVRKLWDVRGQKGALYDLRSERGKGIVP